MIEQIQMTKDELDVLPEYSCSFPTMTTIGKRWKRNTTFGSASYSLDGPWMIGEYVESDEQGKVAILWQTVLVKDNSNESSKQSVEKIDTLVPPKEWLSDSNHSWVIPDGICPSCAAMVSNRVVHRAWHIAIFERTEKPPSSLGWGR